MPKVGLVCTLVGVSLAGLISMGIVNRPIANHLREQKSDVQYLAHRGSGRIESRHGALGGAHIVVG